MSEAELRKPEPPRKNAGGIPLPPEVVPEVPPRNNVKAAPIFKKGAPTDIYGEKEPGFQYQWVERVDPTHPQHVDKYLNPRHVGDQEIGFCEADPWELVSSKRERFTGNRREDSGAPIDTTVTNGSLILVRTPDSNYEIFRQYDLRRQDATAARLGHAHGQDTKVQDDQSGGRAAFKTHSFETGQGQGR